MRSHDKAAIAVYLRYFLSPSETFVYRQLLGVCEDFFPIALTAQVQNAQLFPFEPVYECQKSFFDRVSARLTRMATGRYTVLSGKQRRVWGEAMMDNAVALVHSHFGHYGLDMLNLTRERGIPLLVTFHGFDASSLLRVEAYARELRELFAYAHVITVSRNMAERLAAYGLDETRLDVHYIGVPVENFDFVERKPLAARIADGDPVRFVQVSNFVEKKGHRYTVEAFARYLPDHPRDVLTLAGDGPMRASVEALAREKGIADRVRFPGRVVKEQVGDLMRGADVFVHHSVTSANGDMEGIPTVIMEAMSTGLVVISTRHSGIPELIEDGREGLLVAERDVDGYVECLRGLVEADPEIPRRARNKIERSFNIATQNGKLAAIYRRVIDGGRA